MSRFVNGAGLPIRPLEICVRVYLITFLAGCAASQPPTTTTEARSMQTRTISASYNQVLKASVNVMQDLNYSIELIDKDLGLLVANRLSEAEQADISEESKSDDGTPTWQKVLGISLIIVIIGGIVWLVTRGGDDDDSDDEDNGGVAHRHYHGRDSDSRSGAKVYQYEITVNLERVSDEKTKVRVSVQGQKLVGGRIVDAGPIYDPEHFQSFFASLDKALFLED